MQKSEASFGSEMSLTGTLGAPVAVTAFPLVPLSVYQGRVTRTTQSSSSQVPPGHCEATVQTALALPPPLQNFRPCAMQSACEVHGTIVPFGPQ